MKKWLLAALALSLATATGFSAGRRWQRSNTEREVVGWANGLAVTRAFLGQLNGLWETDALTLALDYLLIEDAARLAGIQLSAEELEEATKSLPRDLDPEAYRVTQRYFLLAKKLALRRFDLAQKRKIWETLGSNLALTKIRVVLFASQTDLDSFWEQKPTAANFARLAREYNASSALALREGSVKEQSLTALRNLLGPEAAEVLETTGVGQVTSAVDSKVGKLVALVESRRESFEDLQGEIDQLLFVGERVHLSYDLRNEGEVRTRHRLTRLSPAGSSFLNPMLSALEQYQLEKESAVFVFDPKKAGKVRQLGRPTGVGPGLGSLAPLRPEFTHAYRVGEMLVENLRALTSPE